MSSASSRTSETQLSNSILGIIGSRRFISNARKNLSYAPTYRLSPHIKPSVTKVRNIMGTVMEHKLKDFVYSVDSARLMSLSLSDEIKDRLKYSEELKGSRYRIVVNSTIGEKVGQELKISSQCCWSSDIDSHVSFQYGTSEFFCVSTAYLIYKE